LDEIDRRYSPAEDSQYKIQNKERTKNNKADEEHPWPPVAHRIINLQEMTTNFYILIQRIKNQNIAAHLTKISELKCQQTECKKLS